MSRETKETEKTKVNHPKDIEYFEEYPAPLMEKITSGHFTNINSTISYYGPMLYFLIRALGCEQILEIGHAEGYSAYYIAHALKDNATRFEMKGNRYHGIDICQTEKTRSHLEQAGLPVKIYQLNSEELPGPFKGKTFDMIFQDGNHETKYVLHELHAMWPQLKGEGKGYWVFHDCYGPAEEAARKFLSSKSTFGDIEYIRFDSLYGLMLIRKMEGYDYTKRHWTN